MKFLKRIFGGAKKKTPEEQLRESLAEHRKKAQDWKSERLSLTEEQKIERMVQAIISGNDDLQAMAVGLIVPDIGAPAVIPLLKLLKHDDMWVRWHAAAALGGIGDNRVLEPLKTLLNDDSNLVRESATEAISRIQSR